MDNTIRASLLFISFVLATWCLYITRDIIAPFALAIFIWLVIDAFARWMDDLSPKFPYWLALTVAILTVIAGMIGVVLIIADTATDVARQAPAYEAKLGKLFGWVLDVVGQDDVSWPELNERFGLSERLQTAVVGFANSIQGVVSNFLFIIIYVGFLFAAQNSFPKKMDDLFPDKNKRAQASKVAGRIRHSIETYIGVQTDISIIQTVLSYIIMISLGLDNALFWSLVIFVLNYIPLIGAAAAWILPTLFAMVQFDSTGKILLLAVLLFAVQTVIANTLQPKMMGDSMNLSALVVVLSITLWGALWGGVGAFLSAPLTVIIMIILAQFSTTRWIAVLLSSDGQPDLDPVDKIKATSTPSL